MADVACLVDGKGHLGVEAFDQVAQFFTTLELVLLQPLLHQLLLALHQHRPAQFHTLHRVELPSGQQGLEVLQDGLGLVGRLGLQLLELVQGLVVAQQSPRGRGSHLGRLQVVSHGHGLVEAVQEDLIAAREGVAPGQGEGQGLDVVDVALGQEEGHQGLAVDVHTHDAAFLVDQVEAIVGTVPASHEHNVLTHLLGVDALARRQFVHVHLPVLGHHVQQPELLGDLHVDGEVIGLF